MGILNRSTKNEQDILNTVTSLTNKGVTKAIVRKEIDFQPHLKDITIFFSDIRGFTAISDGFNKRFGEKSAGEIIGFLNDYMSRMVNCISITGGNVDKFEGDAIMACWGVLRDDNIDIGKDFSNPDDYKNRKELHKKHVEQDALSAIKATVGMRYALMKYNKDAEIFTKKHADEPLAKYKPHIRIGCGLNTGRATVGFMGSKEKMEFTSIGDAVNLASRTESSNKPCGTDILITQDTYSILCKNYIRCEDNDFTISKENIENEIIVEKIPVTFEVKGKGSQNFYGVVNMPNFDIEAFFKTTDPDFKADPECTKCAGPNGPKSLKQVRELLGIPEPDFERVNLNAEESKVTAK
ncbi:MAG: adenylate/guanylate cyclase domain-containing protein [Treponema sp.]|nr:adenylate/guanylate cyclase domain-containing protein [Candidatus Treponema merdequi]